MAGILVTGGAGYIGSHTVAAFRAAGHDVRVLDDLSEGHRESIAGVELVVGDVGDRDVLDRCLGVGGIHAVVHFAARCYVGESVREPRRYYRQNFVATLSLLEAMVDHGIPALVFSSSCAVYGDPEGEDLAEDRKRAPINPYGRTKAAVEWAVSDFGRAYGLRSAVLRYFNAAGADPSGARGEDHDPETHLVPLVIREALSGRGTLKVFGGDYPTEDGTCVRDYVHVTDLADAHVRAVGHLLGGGESVKLNLGTGRGHSVLEVIEAVRRCSGRDVAYETAPRRPGDPPRLVARPGKALEVLGWEPRHSDLTQIVGTALAWHESRHGGDWSA